VANLILVPTPHELGMLRDILGDHSALHDQLGNDRWAFQLCGFGPVAAAARTGSLISRYRPEQLVLVGVAGSFDLDRRPIGSAWQFHQIACYGIGVGTGPTHQTAAELGWSHFEGDAVQPTVGDQIDLLHGLPSGRRDAGLLLTCPSASANDDDVRWRLEKYPDAQAEDMEAFAVAASCLLSSVPLRVVRGISNAAGDRDKRHWAFDEALAAAGDLVGRLIEGKH
jgi:futalosine hydrolase